ncbi:A0A072W8A4 (Uncharacterized protein) [Bacillus mycoides]|nr:A0A072W8A4 (Uncharacterized protein) [Bacillus mycoides]
MGNFQSNFQTATQIATQMRNASDTIQSATNRSIHYLLMPRRKKRINKC